MRFWACPFMWILLAVYFVAASPAASEQKRLALVVGNSAYIHAGELPNPRNDAADIAAALEKLGFEVIRGIDLDKQSMERTLRQFASALSGAELGLFFYAGHGLQVNGHNYLVPIDAKLEDAAGLDFEVIRLDLIQRIMEREGKTNILFLDACRNNPLARNLARAMGTRSISIGRGLAAAESGVGTLISYSTQPGNVALDGDGRNSPFAKALVEQLLTSRDDLSNMLINVRNSVMRQTKNLQVPWEHSALTAKVYFSPPAPGDVTAARPSFKQVAVARNDTANASGLSSFDGSWTLTLFGSTERCRPRAPVLSIIIRGRTITGRVARGDVSGSISASGVAEWTHPNREGHPLRYRGSFNRDAGSGSWERSDGRCWGTFVAKREGQTASAPQQQAALTPLPAWHLSAPARPRSATEDCATRQVAAGQDTYCASSVLGKQLGNTYGARNLFDGATDTAWVEGRSNSGLGEWIVVSFEAERIVSGIRITNGYHKHTGRSNLFLKNNRVRHLRVTFSSGRADTIALRDSGEGQFFTFAPTERAYWVQLSIDGIYRGTDYDDTAISELEVVSHAVQ